MLLRNPSSFTKASKDTRWLEAMQKEIDVLETNQTWVITDRPVDKTIVDCKWVYKEKYHSDGTIERFKACLVTKGFIQVEGLDFMVFLRLLLK